MLASKQNCDKAIKIAEETLAVSLGTSCEEDCRFLVEFLGSCRARLPNEGTYLKKGHPKPGKRISVRNGPTSGIRISESISHFPGMSHDCTCGSNSVDEDGQRHHNADCPAK